jgi:geranylgeranyl pyrophosphate synthase
MVDVDLSISPPADLEVISKKNMYKTASYTFIRPMMTGAILAGADAETRELIRQLAENLGLAFQLRDDLQDLTG